MSVTDRWQGRPDGKPSADPVPGRIPGGSWLLSGGRVVTPGGVLSPGWIRVTGGLIDAVGPGDGGDQHRPGVAVVDVRGQWALPGFVDMHTHGGGTSFTEGTSEDARRAAEFHRAHGSTTMLASLVTAPVADSRRAPPCWPGWPRTASSPASTWRGRSFPGPGAAPRIRSSCSLPTWPSSNACAPRPTAAAGMPDGSYRLGSMRVTVAGGVARLADGTGEAGPIAGSTATMAGIVRHAAAAGLPVPDIAAAASTTPARVLGLGDRTGSLHPGLAADLVLCDEEFRLRAVMADGQWLRRH